MSMQFKITFKIGDNDAVHPKPLAEVIRLNN